MKKELIKWKYRLKNIYYHKIDRAVQMIFGLLFYGRPLQDIIVIESHNDFDCNSGTFYDYLIKHEIHKRYKIVWLLKNPLKKKLPPNVEGFLIKKPCIKKDYYISNAKYMLADNFIPKKVRKGQITVYCTHGSGGLKNVKGNLTIPPYVDYVLFQSPRYAPIQANQFSMEYPSKRIVYLGFPIHDVLNSRNNEIAKITKEHFDKTIIWMPTFRKKGGEIKRIDSDEEQPLGIPLLSRMEEYHALNAFLKKKNALLILKIHPMQDLSDLKIYDLSNICVLTGNRVKELGVDTYKLMSCSDAMISDYSGAAFDYLQVNKPIAYVLSDKDSYRLGFVLDDISRLLAGPAIYSINDMYAFISDVMEGTDQYQERRKEVKEFIFEYNDTNNCERLAKFLGLL